MDMGVWDVKPSRYSTYLTSLDQGLIPGLIYKFAWKFKIVKDLEISDIYDGDFIHYI